MPVKSTAIVADFLCNYGGIEKEVVTLAKNFDSDIYAGLYVPEKTFPELKKFNIKSILKKKLPEGLHSLYLRWKFRSMSLSSYKNIIILGTNSMAIARKNHKSIWICNSPVRYLYGSSGDFENFLRLLIKNPFKRFFARTFLKILKKIDQKDYEHIDCVLANSKNVLERIKDAYPYKKELKIVHPPVDTNKFKYRKTGDFYISNARLSAEKNVDKIVEAFKKMPNKKLIVIGDGLQRQEIENNSKGFENIKILGSVDEEKLIELIGNCIAAFALSDKEDFGMVATEAMAAGKPVIAKYEGGYKETVIEGKTGIFIKNVNPDEIVLAVKKMTREKAKSMRKNCEKRAELFSEKKFIEGVKNCLI